MAELPEAKPPRLVLRRRLVVLVGLLSLVSLAVASYSLIRLGETNAWLSQSLADARELVEAVDVARGAQVHFKKQVQEWKDVLLRGAEPGLFKTHFEAFEAEQRNVRAKCERLKEILADLEIPTRLVDEFLALHESLGRRYAEAIESYDRDAPTSAFAVDRLVRGIDRDATDRLDAIVADMEARWDRRIEQYADESVAEIQKQRQFSEGVIAIVACGILIAVFFSLTIMREIRSRR